MVHSNLNDGRVSTNKSSVGALMAAAPFTESLFEQLEFSFEFGRADPQEEPSCLDLPGNDYDWKEHADVIHQRMLKQSLHVLMDNRASQRNKDQIVDWIFHPIVEHPRPFSFQACCIFSNVDTEVLQDHLRWLIDRF